MRPLPKRHADLLALIFEQHGLRTFERGGLDARLVYDLIKAGHLENVTRPGEYATYARDQIRVRLKLPAGYEKRGYLGGVS